MFGRGVRQSAVVSQAGRSRALGRPVGRLELKAMMACKQTGRLDDTGDDELEALKMKALWSISVDEPFAATPRGPPPDEARRRRG